MECDTECARCNHALHVGLSAVRHFSYVNRCALDMAKTFDRVNHYALFIKLIVIALMNTLINWYVICTAYVRGMVQSGLSYCVKRTKWKS